MADKKRNTGIKVQKRVQLIEKKEKKKKKRKKPSNATKKKATTSNTSLMNQLSLL